jgi:hypothetical protein
MLRGRQEDQWAHTAQLIATIVNFSSTRDPKKPPVTFEDVYPFADKPKPIHDMAALKEEWTGMVKQLPGSSLP